MSSPVLWDVSRPNFTSENTRYIKTYIFFYFPLQLMTESLAPCEGGLSETAIPILVFFLLTALEP